jgi:hypothetical protein
MGFFTSVKNAGLKTKIRADMKLLDRETVARKQKLGVELYNLLMLMERSRRGGVGASIGLKDPPAAAMSMFHARQDSIKVPLDACRADVGVLEDRKEGMEQELVHMECNRDKARMARTNGESLQQAAGWVSDSGVEAKIQVQMKLLDREIHQRKELFGLQVYDLIILAQMAQSNSTTGAGCGGAAAGRAKTAKRGMFGGVKANISNRLSKLSSDEKAIEECIDRAKKDVTLIQTRKDRKEREIAQLDEESAAS